MRKTAFNFFKWLLGKTETSDPSTVEVKELCEAAQELQIRVLAFRACVNMIANAIGRCECRTFVNGKEVRDREYYMLNVEPNVNQNSTAFWHKVIHKLYTENEALIISTRTRDGREGLVVADGWTPGLHYPSKMNEYYNVSVDDFTYSKTFRENEVIHLKLNQRDIRPVLEGMLDSYGRMLTAAENYYQWKNGRHVKVHVSQISQNGEKWQQSFQAMLENQVMPFLKSENGILPEFDGYEYENFGGESHVDSTDARNLAEDVFNFTARALLIPAVLVNGKIEGTSDANSRFLTYVVSPNIDQIQEEFNRKRYGFDAWKSGTYMQMDSSSILHFDIFANAANIEKLVGSGVFSLNDVLRAANLPAIDESWANEHYMTLNISTMNQTTRNLEGG